MRENPDVTKFMRERCGQLVIIKHQEEAKLHRQAKSFLTSVQRFDRKNKRMLDHDRNFYLVMNRQRSA
jgi:hypothetical protein